VNGNDFVLLSDNFNQASQIAAPAVVGSESADPGSNDAVSTVLGKHDGKSKPRHGAKS